MITLTPTTHTPGDPGQRQARPMVCPAAPRDYRHAQVAIDRLRQKLDEAEALLTRQLPAGHMAKLSKALDDSVASLKRPVDQVKYWASARGYPVRREADSVEIGGRS